MSRRKHKTTESFEKQKGRPLKVDGPRVPYEELDKLLVFGEQVPCDDGSDKTTVHYPTMRELARRFEVSVSLVSKYAHQHNCKRRREEAQARIHAKVDQQLIEFRASAIARSREDEIRTIDDFLSGFEEAVAEGRVRVDNPSDYNQMIRLREFLMGGADSRQEVNTSVSLEELQARHRQMLRTVSETSAAERQRIGPPGSDHGEDSGEDGKTAAAAAVTIDGDVRGEDGLTAAIAAVAGDPDSGEDGLTAASVDVAEGDAGPGTPDAPPAGESDFATP